VDLTGDADLEELKELLKTARVAVVGEMTQRRETAHPNLYLGQGKLEELKPLLKSADANLVVCDDELTPRQERNLEAELKLPVIDRTALILDIFAMHAHTAEGKLQVELAQLEYNLARMRGLWTHLERLGGGIGTRGPGETQIETDRRLARDRISALRRQLTHVSSNRAVMRAERQRAHLPQIALAGYTNAGKSTLFNSLTNANVGVQDSLFHTLDPTTRTFTYHGRPYLLTDTVGFIRKLPHQLVDAFAATLEETQLADIIVHVIDASVSNESMVEMMGSVESVLKEIGVADRPTIIALNKCDLLTPERRAELEYEITRKPLADAVLVSALTGDGVEGLCKRIATEFERTLKAIDLLVPYSDGATLSQLHNLAGDLTRDDTPAGVRVQARVPGVVADRLRKYDVNGAASDTTAPTT
jgi:GTP-binding protein HflX